MVVIFWRFYSTTLPPPLDSMHSKFELCFRSGNISVCNGCKNKFDKNARHPLDLVVRHQEWRRYTSPISSQAESRFGNAYYHTNPGCILARWPSFSCDLIAVSEEVLKRLQQQHKEYIKLTFNLQL